MNGCIYSKPLWEYGTGMGQGIEYPKKKSCQRSAQEEHMDWRVRSLFGCSVREAHGGFIEMGVHQNRK